ncbi:MAG: ABC transporter ATP-binding protein [Synergistaceae bacterium]|jgi:iron complex transport system ATP-binding protein|nr:ABC transporter ATP-binding protein [Synergistaceae bacterium]
MLRVENLSADIQKIRILHEISFAARKGEVLALLGPNGCGKSTLIKTILGLCGISSGNVSFEGRDISPYNRKKKALIFAYMPQNTASNSFFTVLETVVMGRYPHLGTFGSYAKRDFEIARDAIKRTGLSGFEDRLVSSLSGGEAAAVMLARSLAQDTPVMLLDEPMSSLDPGHALAVADIIKKLAASGKLLIVSMHDVNMALNHSDRLILLKNGHIFGDIPTERADLNILTGLYGISWEIWRTPKGHITATPRRD